MIPLCIIPQAQAGDDCAVVALSMWLGVPYPQVAAAVATVRPMALANGMFTSEIKKVGKIFGRTLKTRRSFNIDDDPSGILTLAMKDGHHAVVLFEGVVLSDGKLWNYEAYLKQANAKPLSLLTEDE